MNVKSVYMRKRVWGSVILFVLVMLLYFGFGIARISGNSMFPTLRDGEYVIFQKICNSIKPGDIVIVKDMHLSELYFIKRVVAVEGQTVDIFYRENTILVDGILQNEPYINTFDDDILKSYNGRNYETYTVPADCIFLLGDNRNHSVDSRKSSVGYVPTTSVIGKLFCIQKT